MGRFFLTLFLAAALSAALGGCSSPAPGEFTPLEGEKVESQWTLRLEDGGRDTPLTGAMAVSADNPAEGRLYVMLPMGQTLGKCVLSAGGAVCQPSVPGAAPLLQNVAAPMARLIHAGEGVPSLRPLRGRGWRCDVDGDWLVYREQRAKWTLRLKRMR